MRPSNPICPICREPMIKEIYGEGFRCIYPHEPRHTRQLKRISIALFILAGLLMSFTACGCTTTITPPKIHDTQASWDGNQQNSGFIQFNEDGSALITPHARDRYNGLIDLYGGFYKPRLKHDDGLEAAGDVWKIDAEHLVKFGTMNRWRKENKPTDPVIHATISP